MTTRTTPPFRADHVGSFLRPKYLLDAREQAAAGAITREALRKVEDQAIKEIVDFQQDVGLQSVTDGEFRRTYFHIDFLEQLGGVKTDLPVTVKKPDGTEELAPPVIRVVDKVRHAKDIQKADFEYLKSQVASGHTPKVTIPSPTMLHFRGGRAGISKQHYPELDPDFYDELRSLAAAGCTYVQMDDTNLAYLCDDKLREAARSRGDDPDELPHRYASFINKVVAQKPQGMTLAIHLCRGNFKSTWAAQGSYEPVAEALLSEMDVDAYFLEYDDARSGDFKPLRFLPKGKTVVLGLVTTRPVGESGRPQAAHRRGVEVRPARTARAQPAVRIQQHRPRQQHRGGATTGQAEAGGGGSSLGVGQLNAGNAAPDAAPAASLRRSAANFRQTARQAGKKARIAAVRAHGSGSCILRNEMKVQLRPPMPASLGVVQTIARRAIRVPPLAATSSGASG
jgi:5-methyltetrahydropteroyltriglutamate--homocysteine methyltransferase